MNHQPVSGDYKSKRAFFYSPTLIGIFRIACMMACFLATVPIDVMHV